MREADGLSVELVLEGETTPRIAPRASKISRSLLIVAALAATLPLPASPALAAGTPTDITADIRANRDVALSGDTVVNLPSGATITYAGVLSGEGTVTIAGSGRLILTKDSDFTLPKARQRQKVSTGWSGDDYAVTTVTDPDPPAVIVRRGAALQYGPGDGTTGTFGHYPYATPGPRRNGLNIKVDGTLDVAVHTKVDLGTISGSGFILQRRNTWDGISVQGDQPFAGVLYNGTGVDLGSPYSLLSMPNVKKIVNQGSSVVGVPTGRRLVVTQDFYSREYGNDINFNFPLSKRAVAVFTGVYSWADAGPDDNPSLSNPALNFTVVPHRNNKRGINIEGSNVQWGNGTGNRFFLPGNKDTVYLNLHTRRGVRGRLTFDYNGPVTLSAPISGGTYHDTLSTPGAGDIVIAATPGNTVTFAATQNYDGSTTIGKGATLRLGTGLADGDGSLLMSGEHAEVVDNGTLIVQNAKTAVTLAHVSGTGSFTQAGTATTTLTSEISFTGATRVSAGTLALRGGSLESSSAVELSKAGATLDLTRAGKQTIKDLSGASGTTIALGPATLTVSTNKSITYAGNVIGESGSIRKIGAGTLTLSGKSNAAVAVQQGVLRLGGGTATAGSATIAAGATLAGAGTVHGTVTNAGTLSTGYGTTLQVTGAYRQDTGGTLALTADTSADYPQLTVAGPITLAGRLAVAASTAPQATSPEATSPQATAAQATAAQRTAAQGAAAQGTAAQGTALQSTAAQGAAIEHTAPDGARQLTVLNNTGSAAVSGTFDDLPEGAAVPIGGTEFRISYTGGDGNDVVLTGGTATEKAAAAGVADTLGLTRLTSGSAGTTVQRLGLLSGVGLIVVGLVLIVRLRRRAGTQPAPGSPPAARR